MKVNFKSVDEYISTLEPMETISSAKTYLIEMEEKTKNNYEIFVTPDKRQYVVSESQFWEVLSRRGYLMAEYDL